MVCMMSCETRLMMPQKTCKDMRHCCDEQTGGLTPTENTHKLTCQSLILMVHSHT